MIRNLRYVLAAAVAAIVVPGILFAARSDIFPGREVGARQAAERGLGTAITGQDSQNGLTLSVIELLADETQTVISYHVSGREADGKSAMSNSPPLLVDTSGTVYVLTRGSLDQQDRRSGTWVFPPIPSQAGDLTLAVVGGFDLANPEVGKPIVATTVPGTWRVAFHWNGNKPAVGPSVQVPQSPLPFGPGSISLASVTQSASATVVRGTINGFSPEVIQALGCPLKPLLNASGGSIDWISCRLGFGDGYRSFEVVYPPVSGSIRFSFELTAPPSPGRPALPPEVERQLGAASTLELLLPVRELKPLK